MHHAATKICKHCQTAQPLECFYTHPEGKYGRLHICKECHKAAVRENRSKNAERLQQYDRDRAWNPERVAARKAYQEQMKDDPEFQRKAAERKAFWANKNMVKRRAQIMAGNAIRDGRVIPASTCERCGGAGRIQGHHEDYYKPLELTWLCSSCHGVRHREINEAIRNGADLSVKGF
jgi:hypothetical protein